MTSPVSNWCPAPVQVFGSRPELDHKVARQVLRIELAALFPPKPEKRILIIAHDNSGVRAANEAPPSFVRRLFCRIINTIRSEADMMPEVLYRCAWAVNT